MRRRPGVAQVLVSVLNDPLPIVPNTFACQVGSPPNQLVIYNYAPGTYIVSLSGLDVSGNVIWSGSSTVVVNGNVATVVNMQPTPPQQRPSVLEFRHCRGELLSALHCIGGFGPRPDRLGGPLRGRSNQPLRKPTTAPRARGVPK